MNLSNFIPTGRTSLVKKGSVDLQIQTEYAYRPYPRLTTTILTNGQVLHKIEKKLAKPVESFEEQSKIENRMKIQHTEVLNIIKENDTSSLVEKASQSQRITIPEKVSVEQALSENISPSDRNAPAEEIIDLEPSLIDKFKNIAGVKYVYHLNNDGEFVNKIERDNFRNSYAAVFKNISELIEIFSMIPGVTITRERGVYEVERNSLYLISCGDDIYFVVIKEPKEGLQYEHLLKSIVVRQFV